MKQSRGDCNRLRKYRLIMGYSQKEVAKLLGFKNPHRISAWENGTRFPNVRNLLKLSIIYKTLVDQLYIDIRESILEEYRKVDAAHVSPDSDTKIRPP